MRENCFTAKTLHRNNQGGFNKDWSVIKHWAPITLLPTLPINFFNDWNSFGFLNQHLVVRWVSRQTCNVFLRPLPNVMGHNFDRVKMSVCLPFYHQNPNITSTETQVNLNCSWAWYKYFENFEPISLTNFFVQRSFVLFY